jgi:hypothetical protein
MKNEVPKKNEVQKDKNVPVGTPQNKNTKTIIIVVVVLLIVGGVYYGYNRWRQQRVAMQILQGMYGLDAGKTLGGLVTGGGNAITGDVLKKIAEEEAKDELKRLDEEKKEAAKTPEDRFNETEETSVIGSVSSVLKSDIEPVLNSVFGKIKMTSYGTGYMLAQNGSFGANFKVPRVVTANDLSKISEEFEGKGFTVMSSSVESGSGELSLMKGETTSITVSFSDNGENQEIEILYWDMSSEE